jgi:hypothetical protein
MLTDTICAAAPFTEILKFWESMPLGSAAVNTTKPADFPLVQASDGPTTGAGKT